MNVSKTFKGKEKFDVFRKVKTSKTILLTQIQITVIKIKASFPDYLLLNVDFLIGTIDNLLIYQSGHGKSL